MAVQDRLIPPARSAPTHPYLNRLFASSCESMCEIPSNEVALTVTSPPYWNAIDYDVHSKDPGQNYRSRGYAIGYSEYHDYLEWLGRISSEVQRVTKPGGFYALVVGTVLLKGRHYPLPFDLTNRLVGLGWEFWQDFIWHKVTGGVKRAGVFIQRPFPGYFYPNLMTEYILVFRKPGTPIFRGRDKDAFDTSRFEINRLFTNDIANNVWHIAPVPPGHLQHPCPFPEEIPWRLINLYSYRGDLVLDHFAGSGQTLKVARYLGRSFVGYDINEQYVEYALARMNEPPALRPKQLTAQFSKIDFDCPIPSLGERRQKTRYKSTPVTRSKRPRR